MTPATLFAESGVRLAELGQRALARGLRADEFVVVCIEVDSPWRALVDALMPDCDWQRYRDTGASPIARGTVPRAVLLALFDDILPDVVSALRARPLSGFMHAVCLGTTDANEGVVDVYLITPRQEPS